MPKGFDEGGIHKSIEGEREIRAILEKAEDVLMRRISDPRHRRVCTLEQIIISVDNLLGRALTGEHKKAALERVRQVAEKQNISLKPLAEIPLDEARELVGVAARSLRRRP